MKLSLAQWMAFGVPIAAFLLICCWLLLYFTLLRGTPKVAGLPAMMRNEYAKLGAFTKGEITTTVIFIGCVQAWIPGDFRSGLIGVDIDNSVIAIVEALLLFLTPLDRRWQRTVMTWKDTAKLPWGILIFLGGSLSLSTALTETGVTRWLGQELQVMHNVPVWIVAVVVVALMMAVSEMMSNSATVTAFLPILAGLAGGMGIHPFLIMIPATLAVSCAFMMPGASAPNAIAFGTEALKVSDMIKIGLCLNLICAAVILFAGFYFTPGIMGFDPLVAPAWATPKGP